MEGVKIQRLHLLGDRGVDECGIWKGDEAATLKQVG